MLPEIELWKVFVSLGIPGLALGILYMSLRKMKWRSPVLPRPWVGPLALIIILLSCGIIYYALDRWAPAPDRSSVAIGQEAYVSGTVAGRDVVQGKSHATAGEGKGSTETSVEVGQGAIVSGTVAGRDIVLAFDPVQGRVDELVAILQQRHDRIVQQLSQFYEYVEVQEYLTEFSRLHGLHVSNLRQGNIIAAHENLVQIHDLSFKLESDEFWKRHHKRTPNLQYELKASAFQRGPIVCGYVAADFEETCAHYPFNTGISKWDNPTPLVSIGLYKMILAAG